MPLYQPSAIASGTWANRPSPIPASGTLYFATDVGENGTILQSNGTRWRALNGEAALKTLGTTVTGIVNVEQIVAQTLLPAGLLQANDVLRVRVSGSKSGATDSAQLTVRIGTLGTTGDTALTGLSGFAVIGGSSRSGGYDVGIKLISTTSAVKLGVNATGSSPYIGQSSGVAAAATTITDAASNALYLSVGFVTTGTTDTLSVNEAVIKLATP